MINKHRISKVVFLILFILTSSCYSAIAQNKCIERFKVGNFKQTNASIKNVIVRGKKKQIEYFNEGDSHFISKIKWISNNYYSLKVKKCINCDNPKIPIKHIIYVKIIECLDNQIRCEVEFRENEFFEVFYQKIDD